MRGVDKTILHYESMLKQGKVLYRSPLSQGVRFSAMYQHLLKKRDVLSILRHKGLSILDIGCGRGDLLEYLDEINIEYDRYVGIDIVPSFIADAKKKFSHKKEARFLWRDADDSKPFPKADFVVGWGLFDHRETSMKQYKEFFKTTCKKMFDACREGIGFDVFHVLTKNPHKGMALFDLGWVWKFLATEVAVDSERVLLDCSYAPHIAMCFAWKEKSACQKELEKGKKNG